MADGTPRHGDKSTVDSSDRRISKPLFVLILVTAGLLTVFLLALGSKGSDIADVLGLLFTILAAAPTIANFWPKNRRHRETDRRPLMGPRGLYLGAALAALLGVGGASAYWYLGNNADVNVTSDVRLHGGERMRSEAQAVVAIPGRLNPPQRNKLAITLMLINPAKTGDCVGAARLDAALSVDGQPPDWAHRVAGFRPGAEVELDLDSVTKDASVVIVLHEPDPACEVNLRVDRALLYN